LGFPTIEIKPDLCFFCSNFLASVLIKKNLQRGGLWQIIPSKYRTFVSLCRDFKDTIYLIKNLCLMIIYTV